MDTGQHETACLARKTATILITALTLIMCRPLLSVGKCSYGRLAEFERSPIMARTQAGIQRAKERGVAFGRPTKLNAKQRRMIAERYRCRGDRGGARAPVRGGRGDCLAGAQWTLGPVFRYAFEERPMTAIEVDIIRQLRRTLAKVWERDFRSHLAVLNRAKSLPKLARH